MKTQRLGRFKVAARSWSGPRNRLPRFLNFGTVVATSLFASCGGATDPDPMLLPAFLPPVLGIDSIVVGVSRFACAQWIGDVPDENQRLILDLVFPKSPTDPEGNQALSHHVTAVEEAGGQIVHHLRFKAVRADLAASAVADLYGMRMLDYALNVPYSDRFDFPVAAPFAGTSSSAESAFLEAGGQVDSVLEHVKTIIGAIPNDSVDLLRQHPQFDRIGLPAARCQG